MIDLPPPFHFIMNSASAKTIKMFYLGASALFLSLLLNFFFFFLMPVLINTAGHASKGEISAERPLFSPVQRFETCVQKKEIRSAPPKLQYCAPMPSRPDQCAPDPEKPVPQPKLLPFEINRALPGRMGDVTLPALEMRKLDIASLTNLTVSSSDLADSACGLSGLNGTYFASEIDQPLIPIAQAQPLYPIHAQRSGIEGEVKIRFLVNETGRVENVEIIQAIPGHVFDQSVIKCVSNWRFKPGTVKGIPVNTLIETTIRFELKG